MGRARRGEVGRLLERFVGPTDTSTAVPQMVTSAAITFANWHTTK